MSGVIKQFGSKPAKFRQRPCAYALVLDAYGKMLVVKSNGYYQLVGGGIDEGETPEQAVIREAREEAGYGIILKGVVGKANQYFSETELGPLNKTAVFYRAIPRGGDISGKVEEDHEVSWMLPQEFLALKTYDFQRWAVEAACGDAARKAG